jgi:AraC-like DNA-binding protein
MGLRMISGPDCMTHRTILESTVLPDPLSDVLRMVRLTGGVFLDAHLSHPYCVEAAVTPDTCGSYIRASRQIIGYHYVAEGSMFVSIDRQNVMRIGAGDIVLLPRNDVHTVASSHELCLEVGLQLTLPPSPDGLARVTYGGGGAQSRIICGFLASEDEFNPLIATLPRLLKLNVKRFSSAEWLESSVRFALQELTRGRPATSNTISRLSELLFVEAVRNYIDNSDDAETGWLRGLRDNQIGRTLALLHGNISQQWTVDGLAKAANFSRTAFINKFNAAVGVPPMRYITNWRMKIARLQLRDTNLSVAQVGYSVGYESEEAFSRAFKREVGVSPSHWRDQNQPA